ncbi:MAG: Polyribonucleotide nucleotidyltransferase [Candidatus Jorgensenbacteria bacterium GW2011_GWA1_48_11]|uniref:Polyribonucleotide nucleotidyltransferase n=1 Tax=Candidatus Jorgensenbacteria bacterium GW2011_GWA1_48_11 TaxID=1618660 RepID=A0A0G1UBS4_9BACT|nr:MAG: Polyribonucleotide nucleotidyltransferase [Candidatus Jorgensenbacteria bacterium GW2011_GWA1_48_11]KKW12084.1 MAG: Polyribonucleotide nucleotidyltransferase [Candidatus Jorgensenbacteria bacterium GW2011_GWB1_49_9]
MDLNRKIYTTELNGEKAALEISKLAGKANAAVLGTHGDTAVLATVIMGTKDVATDYFPLTVDYEEKFYAAGKILGSRFIRREGRPSDEAVLSGRLIDRTIRPLFDQRLRREVQIMITILAYDEKNDPDAISLLAASTALAVSDIPWAGPVAGIKTVINQNNENIVAFFAGPEEKINMIEFEGKEIEEEKVAKLFEASQTEIKRLVDFQRKITSEVGKPKIKIDLAEPDPRIKKLVADFIEGGLEEAIEKKTLGDLKTGLLQHLAEAGEPAEILKAADDLFEHAIDVHVHQNILKKEKRPDGRKLNEVRDLYGEVGLFKRTHGSGLFVRGDTQSLAITTLASPAAEQLVETMEATSRRRFMLHYNFPSFSTGEIKKRGGGPGRREIGHGALAQKALVNLIPSKEEFPYTIRVVAETLSSNGSSSMASTCAAALSMMDAGVPLLKQAAGIAMGLMLSEDHKDFKILTDIQGPEDHHGDMDMKVAGTEAGVTAIQMDVKVVGITPEIFRLTLAQAKEARLHILKTMEKVLAKPRPKVSPFAPTIYTYNISPDKIGLLIGPGGKTINGIIAMTGGKATIDIDEDGKVFVASTDAAAAEKTLEIVKQMMREYKIGDIVEGPIIKILEFGAIVDLGGGQDGMIHVSELREGFVKKVEDVVKLGDVVKVKIIKAENGKIGLSLKALK